MKIYLRILQYSPRVKFRFFQFVIFSLLAAVFSAVYLGLLSPMLEILFDQKKTVLVPSYPDFEFSVKYARALFEHHFISIINERGRDSALFFVCLSIVFFVLLSNVF